MKVHALAILHPAYIVRDNYPFERAQIHHLRRAHSWLTKGTFPRPLNVETDTIPNAWLDPTFNEIVLWLTDCIASKCPVVNDIESAGPHIRLVGLMRLDPEHYEHYIAIHIRRQYGAQTWSDEQLATIIDLLDQCFTVNPQWMHNGQAFDVPELEQVGFTVAEIYYAGGDTMLMQRHAFVGAPANLQSCAITYAGMRAWKHIVKSGGVDEQEDK